jgi:hypothetical protein
MRQIIGCKTPIRGLLAAVVITTTSCKQLCTLVTCGSGLEISFTGNVPTGGRVTASTAGLPPRFFECPSDRPCTRASFGDFTPARVSITMQSSGAATTQEFTPTYRVWQPNGKDCEPTCRTAEIEMPLQ